MKHLKTELSKVRGELHHEINEELKSKSSFQVKRPIKTVTINQQKVSALIDTGSDYTVIRKDVLRKYGIDHEIEGDVSEVKGVGGIINLIGKFKARIQIDSDIHDTDCFIISSADIDDEMIIGLDIVNNCTLIITPNTITLEKFEQKRYN